MPNPDIAAALFLVLGILFSLLNAYTAYLSWRGPRFVSPIPFFGAICLFFGVVLLPEARLWYGIAIAADVGTLRLLIQLPAILTEWWGTSRFCRVDHFQAVVSNRRCEIQLFRRGQALLTQDFDPPVPMPNQPSIQMLRLSWSGQWSETAEGYRIVSYADARSLVLKHQSNGTWHSTEAMNDQATTGADTPHDLLWERMPIKPEKNGPMLDKKESKDNH
ncbi:MAG: hypothetical protein ACRCZF_17170 [Gemmataceae bacterium]